MSQYRSRVSRLVAANRRQRAEYSAPADHSQVPCVLTGGCGDLCLLLLPSKAIPVPMRFECFCSSSSFCLALLSDRRIECKDDDCVEHCNDVGS